MPLREGQCNSCQSVREWYQATRSEPDPPCDVCGGILDRFASRFAVVFTGPITSKYNISGRDDSHQEGHVAWRTRSSRSGNPEPVRITTWQQQKEYCKQEGLLNPGDLSSNAEVSSDGKKLYTRGMPGQWI